MICSKQRKGDGEIRRHLNMKNILVDVELLQTSTKYDTIFIDSIMNEGVVMTEAYETYQENIKRVKNFITLYENATQGTGAGRKGVKETDILRAGVVFLHSTLEEYLRTIILNAKKEMLTQNKDLFQKVLGNVALPGDNSGKSTGKKYGLIDFWDQKDKTIMEVISESLDDKVGYLTFNEYSQIVGSLQERGVRLDKNYNVDGLIDNYIKRRHKIVHEADKNATSGRGNFHSSPINTKTLNAWIDAVDAMVIDIQAMIEKE